MTTITTMKEAAGDLRWRMIEEMPLRNYSERTQESYVPALEKQRRFAPVRPPHHPGQRATSRTTAPTSRPQASP